MTSALISALLVGACRYTRFNSLFNGITLAKGNLNVVICFCTSFYKYIIAQIIQNKSKFIDYFKFQLYNSNGFKFSSNLSKYIKQTKYKVLKL